MDVPSVSVPDSVTVPVVVVPVAEPTLENNELAIDTSYAKCSINSSRGCCCLCCRILSVPGDACMCFPDRRCYPNARGGYLLPLLLAQACMFLASSLAQQAYMDCEFVMVKSTVVDPFLMAILNVPDEYAPDRQKTGLGFVFFQDMEGQCISEPRHDAANNLKKYNNSSSSLSSWAPIESVSVDSGTNATNYTNYTISGGVGDAEGGLALPPPPPQKFNNIHPLKESNRWFDEYSDYLGSEWDVARCMAMIAAGLSLIGMGSLFSYAFLSHTQRLRRLWVAVVLVIICPAEALTWLVFASDVCHRTHCEPGRAAWMALGSIPLFVAAALLVLFKTSNYYPGIERYARPNQPIQLDHDHHHSLYCPEAAGNSGDTHESTNSIEPAAAGHVALDDGLSDAKEVPVPPNALQEGPVPAFLISSTYPVP